MPYIPPLSKRAADIHQPQIRLLIMGPPCSGKTWAAATFPNPIYIDLDGSSTSVKFVNPNALIIPFCQDSVWKQYNPKSIADAFKVFLFSEAPKFDESQTLVVDSLSAIEDGYHKGMQDFPILNGKGEENSLAVWGKKLDYFRDIHTAFKSLRCNVVVTAHIREIRDDKTGTLLKKIGPSLTGSFADKLNSYYTDVFLQLFGPSQKDPKITKYMWQTKGDERIDLKSRMPSVPQFIEASYSSFTYNTSLETKDPTPKV